jgi:hypothetical protein
VEVSDVVVTVPKQLWLGWIDEGDLPESIWSGYESHFWLSSLPDIHVGERVYVVAHGKLRGYAPLVGVEKHCRLNWSKSCLVRRGNAVSVTIAESILGFRGFRYRWWDRGAETPFPDWKKP